MFVTHGEFKATKDSEWTKCIMIGKDVDSPSAIIYTDAKGNPMSLEGDPWDYRTKHYKGCASFDV